VKNASVNLGGVLASGFAVVVLILIPWRLAFVPVAGLVATVLVFTHL